MALGIAQHGIVHRHEGGETTIVLPDRNGGAAVDVEVPRELADAYRLVTGDVAEGPRAAVEAPEDAPAAQDGEQPAAPGGAAEGAGAWRLASLSSVNALPLDEVPDRPYPRSRRSEYERTPPDRLLPIATSAADLTGRMLEFAAPLGAGCMGVVRGPHGSGLTRTLRTVLAGVLAGAPDCVAIALLVRPRSEEVTDWRRRYPQADVVVCPSAANGCTADETLRVADLVLECAQRQTELGRDVVLLVDSLTDLWGAMLEAEDADAQAEADRASARLRVYEWVQRSGCFHGETLLGGNLGGSLTILGSVWDLPVDEEAEEEHELHPHLRVLEHITAALTWRASLSGVLAGRRLYPAFDAAGCTSRCEDGLLPAALMERLYAARASLPLTDPVACHVRLMEAIEQTADLPSLVEHLVGPAADGPPAGAADIRALADRLFPLDE